MQSLTRDKPAMQETHGPCLWSMWLARLMGAPLMRRIGAARAAIHLIGGVPAAAPPATSPDALLAAPPLLSGLHLVPDHCIIWIALLAWLGRAHWCNSSRCVSSTCRPDSCCCCAIENCPCQIFARQLSAAPEAFSGALGQCSQAAEAE